ncbi:MAG: hypothetical protein K1000chlam1_01447 [Candidatus Anoxychlamydiales bacterium]|nr:hypothetical protein [Candidatus Anoxychlamydiales bacterium]
MKFLSILISSLLLTKAFANPTPPVERIAPIQVIKNSPFLSYSAEFFFQNDYASLAKIIRTGFMCPRYFYDLYDKDGGFSARGITRALSVGLLFPRVTDIDIYDNQDKFIGMFLGKILKRSRAKFNFYDEKENPNAIAYINGESTDIIIVSPDNPAKIFAKFTGQSFGEVGSLNIDFISNDCPIDDRIMKVFAAFVADFYETFMPYYKQNNENFEVVTTGVNLGVVLLDAYLKSKDS